MASLRVVQRLRAWGTLLSRIEVTPMFAGICACLGVAGVAYGQQGNLEEIIITGSRIVRRDLNAPSPILTIDDSAFEQSSAVALETVLNQYPQFNPGATQFTASQNQPTADTSPGASTLNMRGLGAGRSLVLIDGRRAQPINAALAVDINTIPAAMIQSVEVISGGAASTYGPDALAGVVNFKLRTDFQGVKINYQDAVTALGDGAERRVDLLLGGNFQDGRGNAVFSVGWASRDAALQENRDFWVDGWRDPGTEANYPRVSFPLWTPDASNLPSAAAVAAAIPGQTNRSTAFYLNNDGSVFRNLATSEPGYKGPTTFPYKIRTNGALQETTPRGYVSSPMTRYTAFAHTSYSIAENISVFAQGTFVASEVAQLQLPFFLPAVAIPRASARALEPPGLTALLDSRPNPNGPWTLQRLSDGFYGNRSNTNQTKLLELVTGVKGQLAKQWTYEGYLTYGETVLLTNLDHQVWTDRYAAVAQAPNFGKGFLLQPFSPTAASFFCTSGLPLLEPWVMDVHGDAQFLNSNHVQTTQDCLTAITAPMTMRNTVKQRVAEFNVEGKIADMKWGELRSAVGISRRSDSSLYEPDPLWDRAVGAGGSTLVNEIYGEIAIPLPGKLELELGVRESDFSTVDQNTKATTYKALFNWVANDSLRLRGGYQRANRTPNVAELYSGDNRIVTTWAELEPCRSDTKNPWGNLASNPNRAGVQELCRQIMYRDNVVPGNNPFDFRPDAWSAAATQSAGTYSNIQHGNPFLTPEDSRTLTMGAVWQSKNALTFSADWYNIKIEQAVGNLDFQTAYRQCFNYTGVENPTYSISNPYCGYIHRDPTSAEASFVEAVNFNLGMIQTSGVDLDVSWRKKLRNGMLAVRSSLNRLLEWKSFDVPGSPIYDYADSTAQGALYTWQAFTTVSYSTERLSLAINMRNLPDVRNAQVVTNPSSPILPTAAYNVFNLNGAWTFSGKLRLRGGVDNFLDVQPPIVGAQPGVNNAIGTTNTSRYDPLGRRYFVGVTVDF